MKENQMSVFTESENNTQDRAISGYTIYNSEQNRRTKRHDLPSLYPDIPQKNYDIIYAD